MISVITAKIFSELGSNSSLLPMGIKDVSNSLGMTAGSYLASKNKVEGKDRFIDEFGTQAIWLFGIPFFKKVIDLTAYKIAGYNSKFDTRTLKNSKISELAQKFAPTNEIKESLSKAIKNKKIFKGLFLGKFVAATALTMASYAALTSYRHKYTEKEQIEEIKKEMAAEKSQKQAQEQKTPAAFKGFNKKSSQLSFNGGGIGNALSDFMFNPVKNMMILDAGITGERLADARDPQDFMGYVIKEGGFWAFMYFAGERIQHFFEKRAIKKHHKAIDLDIKVLEDENFQKAIGNKTEINKALDEFLFKTVDGNKIEKTDDEIYQYICENPENEVVKTAKKSGIVSEYKQYSTNFFENIEQHLGLKQPTKTDKVDTQKFVDIDKIKSLHKKISTIVEEFNNPLNKEKELDVFFKKVLKLKRLSILKNIGACVGFLGIIIPGIMVFDRKSGKGGDEFQVKKELKEKIAKGEIDVN